MYLYAYMIIVDSEGEEYGKEYTGLTCANTYSEAYKNISSMYESSSESISHLELDELYDSLAPCIELPAHIVNNFINYGGVYKEYSDKEE